MKNENKKMNNKGFSLVELIIVIAIMAVLAAALAPQLMKYVEKSRKSSDAATCASIESTVNAALAIENIYDEVVKNTVVTVEVKKGSVTATATSSVALLQAELVSTIKKPSNPKVKTGDAFKCIINIGATGVESVDCDAYNGTNKLNVRES